MIFIAPFIFLLLIVSTGATRTPFACNPQDVRTSTFPFCKTTLPIPDRVNDLIGRLTLQEKVQLLVNNAIAITRLGIDHYEWWGEALHGVAISPSVTFAGEFPGATSFPQVITTAASFNASLWQQIGLVVSDEARAMYNGGAAGLTFWSPNVNILRDPRWGRSQETPGEDPFLSGTYAANYVRGLQQNDGDQLKVAACCKHYTAYDLDNWNGIDRFHFSSQVSKQDLEETFDVPFKKCVLEGNAASVMCSYNQVNGKPTCADPDLLKGTIRGDWKLNGYIVADCDSVQVFYENQNYTKTPEEAAAVALKAGLDMDCGPYLAVYTEKAVAQKLISEADVNNALFNTFTVQMRLGLYDGEPSMQPYGNLGANDVCRADHQELAVEAARQGIVLLKNNKFSLPLSIRRHRTIAVIGPNSNVTETMIGNYQGIPCRYITPLQGITDYGARTILETGCIGVACVDDQRFAYAENAARQADATVLVMGLDLSIEQEMIDRNDLLLPGCQQELVSRVAMASKGPTILVIMSGGPVDVLFAKNDPRIGGIIWAGYPGQAGGAAIADILFGIANPGGKLPMTWYPQDYLTKVPMTTMGLRPDPVNGYPGRTYRFYQGPVVYPFGHGMSYTIFVTTIANAPTSVAVSLHGRNARNMTRPGAAVRVTQVKCDNLSVELDVDVKNMGSRDGSETLLVFLSPPFGHGAPYKQLVAFKKVHLLAKAQQRVNFSIDVCKQLSIVDKNGIRRIPLGNHILNIGDIRHTLSVQASASAET